MARHGVLGISFDHMHMGDLLREVANHPDAEIAGIYDPDRDRMADAIASFGIPQDRVFTDLDACLAVPGADLAIVCAATAAHAEMVERIARHRLHVLVEKPFAADAAEARRMIAAMEAAGRRLAVNWPLAWYPSHNTAKRLVAEGLIGALTEVHFYDGNRGPLYHLAGKVAVSPEEVEAQKPGSWWYRKASGGGSLLDYLGYGTTLGTWFMDGEAPLELTAMTDHTPGIEVDQHSITIARYARGLSKFETRWGTLTDPWTQQPQPKCGFVLVGRDGSISSYDYDGFVTLQTRAEPVPVEVRADPLPDGRRGPVEYMLARIEDGASDHRPARSGAEPDRPADDRQRRAVGGDPPNRAARAMTETELDAYALKVAAAVEVAAPDLPYQPPMPRSYRPRIALVGAGGIAAAHLAAYRASGFDVAVICNRTLSRAEARRDEFFPDAEATDDIAGTLRRDDIAVVDLTPHPEERFAMIETALAAGKHVLSQKPFVLDLDAGARLADLADANGVRLAVNQNGRWAPHLAWMREAVRAGLIGRLQSCSIDIHWDHGWIAGTAVRGDRRPRPLRLRDPLVRLSREPWHPRHLGLRHPRPRLRPGGAPAAPRLGARRLRRRPGDARLRRRHPVRRRGPHLPRRQRRGADQPRPRPRHPGGHPEHRGGAQPPAASRHLVRGRLRRHDGRAAQGRRGRRRAAARRPRQPRGAGAGLRRHRLGRARHPGGPRLGPQPYRGARGMTAKPASRAALGYAKPQTYEDLRAVLSSGTVHFPKRLRQVAIFLWQHPGDVAVGTISQVAEQAGVQPSTLVRFAQIFGYPGFSDFQGLFKEHVRGSWPEAGVRATAEPGGALHFLNGLVAASQASLGRIGDSFDGPRFEAMVALLAAADLIYVIGSKRAFPVTAYVSLALSQQGVRNVLVDNVGSAALDQVGCIGERDAVLAVSFSPYNSITPDLAALARDRNARIAAITDSTFSPLVRLSDCWLEVVESDFAGFRSLAASLAVGMALVQGVAARRAGSAAD